MDKPSAAMEVESPTSPAIENDIPITSLQDMNDTSSTTNVRPQAPAILDEKGIPISKNKLKKLKRDQEWEAGRAKRKAKRKEKDQEKKERKRAAAAASLRHEDGDEPGAKKPRLDLDASKQSESSLLSQSGRVARPRRPQFVQLPVTFVLDCGFDDLMTDLEAKSLSSQVTRSYSDCHRAPYQAHLMICSFGGRLKERFEDVLACNHKSWRAVTFLEDNFAVAADRAKVFMHDDGNSGRGQGGSQKMVAAFAKYADRDEQSEKDQLREAGEVVYLTSDSENTLSELKPYSTYIVGGIVDKNRHKGLCYKRAVDKNVRTAKLPIGEYMRMQSRFVLATNHVIEIMLRWLECEDWGQAFMKVIPKRKGGTLRVGDGGGQKASGPDETVYGISENEAFDSQKEDHDAVDRAEEERDNLGEAHPEPLETTADPKSGEVEQMMDAAKTASMTKKPA